MAAVVSLAVGIAASTAVFSIAYGAILNPFPYRDPWGIVTIRIQNLKTPQFRMGFSYRESRAFSASPVFKETMLCTFDQALWTGSGEPDSVRTVLMSGNAFEFLGVPALLGRTITTADAPDGSESQPVAVLSYVQWQRKFAGDPSVLNRKILLNGKPYLIIGVMPPRFTWYGRDSLWIPIPSERREAGFFQFRGRLQPGISLESAGQQLHAIAQHLALERPAAFPRDGFKTLVLSMKDFSVSSGSLRKSFVPLMIAVGLLLLIACSNVSNLLLARATAQRREIAIRVALGASRSRIIRHVLVQSLFLAAAGALAGVLLARASLKWMVSLIPPQNLPDEAVISLNTQVLVFCAALSVFTAILFGIAPALQSASVRLHDTLKDAGRGQSSGPGGGRFRSALVVAELMLSMFLLISAAFTLRSFVALETANLGFRSEGVLLARVPLPPPRYRSTEQRNSFYDRVLDRVSNLPQVRAAATSVGALPGIFLTGNLQGPAVLPGDQKIGVAYVSADLFKVLSMPLRKGRAITSEEVQRGDRVAVVNESALRHFWSPGFDPLGRNVELAMGEGAATQPPVPLTVIGVVGDTKDDGLTNPPRPAIFLPATLAPQPFRTIAIQTSGRPELVTSAVRRAIHDLDTALPMADTTTLDQQLDLERVGPRFMSVLLLLFAAIGLILAACGTYGVMSYAVSRRSYEFGIRVALGAQRSDIVRVVVRNGMSLAIAGVLLGLVASMAATRIFRSFIVESTYLTNFNQNDVPAIAAAAGLLVAVALAACYIPANRAAGADPVRSLRQE